MTDPHWLEKLSWGATVLTAVIAVAAAIVAALTVTAMRRDRDIEILMEISNLMQCPEARSARGYLWRELRSTGLTLEEWCSQNSTYCDAKMEDAIGDVCWRLEVVGLLAESATVSMRETIRSKWGPIARIWWPQLEIYVVTRRGTDSRQTFCESFQSFATSN